LDKTSIKLFGQSDTIKVQLKRIRYQQGKLFLQEPNIVYALVDMKSRRGLSSYPYREDNVSQKWEWFL